MAVVDVIKKTFCVVFMSLGFVTYAQKDSTQVYKKKVLESIEIDVLLGYYEQEGTHAAVTGGIGNEDLQNIAPSVVVRIPLNEDDVLTRKTNGVSVLLNTERCLLILDLSMSYI